MQQFQLDRRDPFAAGLDDVLGAIRQRDEALRVDAADVAGPKPPVVELRRIGVLIVGTGDPWTANLDLAHGLTVVGQHAACVVDETNLDAAEHPARGARSVQWSSPVTSGGGVASAASGEVSVMPQPWRIVHAVGLLVLLHHAQRHGRASAAHRSQRRDVTPGVGVEILEYVVPDRRDGGGNRRAPLLNHVDQRRGLQESVRQQQVGAGHHGRVRLTPRVGVEHRDDRQDAVAVDKANSVGRTDRHRVQVTRAVAVHHALRVAGRAAGVTHCSGASFVHDRASRTRSVARRAGRRSGSRCLPEAVRAPRRPRRRPPPSAPTSSPAAPRPAAAPATCPPAQRDPRPGWR